jgi:hypothetical protein
MSPASAEPKKETARISLVPAAPSSPTPTVKMAKTQPLIPAPPSSPQRAPITILPKLDTSVIDSIPQPLCWALLALSAIVFIVQVWIYFS